MSEETGVQAKPLHSLIPLANFKTLLGFDDRDDKMSAFCLITATHTIEQYCKRQLVLKNSKEQIAVSKEDQVCYLREYPVRKIVAVYAISKEQRVMSKEKLEMRNGGRIRNEKLEMRNEELLSPEFYHVVPDRGANENFPYSIVFSPAVFRFPRFAGIRVVYRAGYAPNNVPPDLASACLELAAWNLARYRGKQMGREPSIPESVWVLLEPYTRRVI